MDEEFRRELERFPQLHKQPAAAYFGVGSSAMVHEQVEKAVLAFRKSLALDPTYRLSRQILGIIYADLGENERAIDCFRRIIALGCQGVQPRIPDENQYFHMGWCCERVGRTGEAEEAYRESVRHVPEHYESYLRLGRLYQARAAYAEAAQVYAQALQAYERYDPEMLLLPATSWRVERLTEIQRNLERTDGASALTSRIPVMGKPANRFRTSAPARREALRKRRRRG